MREGGREGGREGEREGGSVHLTMSEEDITWVIFFSAADSPTSQQSQADEEEEDEEDEYGSKGRPVIIIDGSGGQTDFKRWRNTTVHPVHVGKKLTAGELLVS